MATTAADGFNIYLRKLTPSDANRAKASQHRESIKNKLDSKFGLYRMFESGSFSHGTGVAGHSDVDYFASLKSDRPNFSVSALSAVRDCLMQRFPQTHIHVSRPAVVLEFGQGYERVEVIPAYMREQVNGSMSYWIPGFTTEWIKSTPEAHAKYVNAVNATPKDGAKQLARLAKAWKFYCNVPVSSFYLEIRAAAYMANESAILWPFDLHRFFKSLQDKGLGAMNDPTGESGRIESCASAPKLKEALSKLDSAASRAAMAFMKSEAGNLSDAFRYWDLLFGGTFPAYG